MVHQPPSAAWPQASPRLAPWVPCVSSVQSLCGCFGASTPHPHTWCRLSSPPSMMRETVSLPWSNIYIHMTDCHYVSSHQNMSFESIYQKTQKKINNSKNIKRGFGIRYLCLHILLLVVGACTNLPGNLSLHRDSHQWKWSAPATMERSPLGCG